MKDKQLVRLVTALTFISTFLIVKGGQDVYRGFRFMTSQPPAYDTFVQEASRPVPPPIAAGRSNSGLGVLSIGAGICLLCMVGMMARPQQRDDARNHWEHSLE